MIDRELTDLPALEMRLEEDDSLLYSALKSGKKKDLVLAICELRLSIRCTQNDIDFYIRNRSYCADNISEAIRLCNELLNCNEYDKLNARSYLTDIRSFLNQAEAIVKEPIPNVQKIDSKDSRDEAIQG